MKWLATNLTALVVILGCSKVFAQTPSITSFSPTSGLVGTTVTINGLNFSATPANNVVTFNGTQATVSASTATSVTVTVPALATSGPITVTIGAQTATSSGAFTVGPIITDFTPVFGKSGNTVTIYGKNFSTTPASNVVKFNNVTATVTASTISQITATVPATATTGPITVTVGALTGTSSSNFNICGNIAVSVTSSNKSQFTFSATGGVAPYTYSLDGVNFYPSSQFNLSTGTYDVTAMDALGCTGTTDFQINGIVDCGVTQASGGQGTTFTTHILGTGSGQVRITYEMFSIPDQIEVFYNGLVVATTGGLVSGSSTLSFNYAYDPAKPNFCIIKMTAPQSGTAWNYAAFCPAVPVPNITTFSPTWGNVGATVTITGTNLTGSTVKFGTVSATVLSNNGTTMTVSVPAGAVTAPIVITNASGTTETNTPFVVSAYCASYATSSAGTMIESVSFSNVTNPSSTDCATYSDFTGIIGYLTANQTLNLTARLGSCGTNFTKVAKLFIDWNADGDFSDAGETIGNSTATSAEIDYVQSITVPSTVVTGTKSRLRLVLRETSDPNVVAACNTYTWGETEDYSVQFINTTATGSVSPSSLIPFVTSVNLASEPRSFTVSGANLGTSNYTITAPTHFEISASETGTYSTSLTVTPVSGMVASTIYVRYRPTSSGPHSGNVSIAHPSLTTANVQVSGTTVSPSLGVYASLDNFKTTAVGVSSAIQKIRIEAVYVANTVTVTAPANFQIATASSYTTSITLTPASGALNQTLNVRYNPSSAGPHSGNISVASTGFTTLTVPVYGYIAPATAPTITTFSPISGNSGTVVTITGTNFSATPANNTVLFNGVSASVTSSTSTSLVVVVPAGASTGAITVTVSGQSAVTGSDFTVSPGAPTITSFTPTSAAPGTAITISGTNFSTTPSLNYVRFNGKLATVSTASATSLSVVVPAGATSGKISVTVGNFTATSAATFTVVAPTITSFTPASGSAHTTVTITGTNFSGTPGSNTVKFNNVTATVTASTTTSLTVKVPVGATTGPVAVTVSGATGVSASNFTVTTPNPSITGFSPTIGPAGTTVTITGTDFSTTALNNLVKFNGTNATVSNSTANSLTVTVPSGATTGPITVTVGGVTATSSSNFTVGVPVIPSITTFTPTSGVVGATVTITGTNFSTTPANNTVQFNGTTATVTASTATTLTVSVPNGATTGTISVTVNGQTGTSASSFTVPLPTITNINPTSGVIGASVTITGTNFSPTPANNVVKFNGAAAAVTASTATTITTSVPSSATTGPVSVSVGGQTVNSPTNFTVIIVTPTISSFTPTTGGVGTSVTITGTNFNTTPANNIVKFNGVSATVTASTATSITVAIPTGATTGPITVTVGSETGTSAGNFVADPVINSFSPVSAAIGSSVTINGLNFSAVVANNTVRFNGVDAQVTSATISSIVATVPAGATNGPITVTVNGKTATSSSNFSVSPPPVINSINPTSAKPGELVVISGANFGSSGTEIIVKFNGVVAIVSNSTPTTITVLVPNDATTGNVSVTVGGSTTTSATSFEVKPLVVPTVSSISPTTGFVGTTVVITGTNFSSTKTANKVTFNGVAAVVDEANTTSLVCNVPNGASTGKVTVEVDGQISQENVVFTVAVQPNPIISGFTPASGIVGSTVTINGSNLTATSVATKVFFGDILATTTSASASQVVAQVPAGVSFGSVKIKVTVGSLQAISGDFTVLNCIVPPKPTITASGIDTETPLLTSSSDTGNQWFKNGVAISGATSKTYQVTEPGTYTVQVSSGACVSEMSSGMVLAITGTDSKESFSTVIYPNPIQGGSFRVIMASSGVERQFEVVKSDGTVLRTIRSEAAEVDIDASDFSAGIYLLLINESSSIKVIKVFKK